MAANAKGTPYEPCFLVQYQGDQPCECGQPTHDPVTGLCRGCDPVLYRVVGYPAAFFSEGEAQMPALEVYSGARRLGERVVRLIEETGRGVDVWRVEA